MAGVSGEGRLSSPRGLALGVNGSIYVADGGNNRVVVFDSTGACLSRIGTAGSGEGRFLDPIDLATEGRNLYVLEEGNERVQIFDRYETFREVILSRERGEIGVCSALTVDPFGRVYLSDTEGDLVRVFRSYSGEEELVIGGYGVEEGRFRRPAGIAVDRSRRIYVCDSGNDRVQVFGPLGHFVAALGAGGGEAGLSRPEGVAVGLDGTVYVADTGNARLARFSREGKYLGEIASLPGDERFTAPADVVVSQSGILCVSDRGSDRIHIFRCGRPPDAR